MCKWSLHLLTYGYLLIIAFDVSGSMFSPLAKSYGIEVVKRYKHDSQSFTQGLLYHEGFLYESTGLRGHSALLKIDLPSGKALQRVDLDEQYFGEGLALLADEQNDQLVQLTYTSNLGFVYQRHSMKLLKTFAIDGQGWGITVVNQSSNQYLVMTDGSHRLTFLDTQSFQTVKTMPVVADDGPVVWINELEFVEGYLLANVWKSHWVVVIDINSGKVVSRIDLSVLLSELNQDEKLAVGDLNGIAYDATAKRLFVTGKNWPWLFEVRLLPLNLPSPKALAIKN